MSLSVPPAAASASHRLLRTLQELVMKTNRKTVEPYSLCDHKTLAVHVILFFLFSFTSVERYTQTIKENIELFHPNTFQSVTCHSHYVTPIMSEQRAVYTR